MHTQEKHFVNGSYDFPDFTPKAFARTKQIENLIKLARKS